MNLPVIALRWIVPFDHALPPFPMTGDDDRHSCRLINILTATAPRGHPLVGYAEETNRINRERRDSGASDRKELAEVEKKIAAMIAVIEDGGYVRGMVDRLRELEARQDELNERLAAAPADLPDIHPNIADIYRRKVARLAEALDHPEDRDAATSAIRGLIERIVLTPGAKWAEMDAVLHGDLGAILEWAGNRRENTRTDIPMAEKLASEQGRALYKLRRQTVEPVFGVIKAVLGLAGFSLRGLDKVEGEWALVALAYNCKRLHKLSLAT